MTARPAPVRIDDLAEPRFSDDVRAILDFMEEAGSQLTLEPGPLMDGRAYETGLDDFGSPRLRGAARARLCRAMREQGGFNGAGVMQQHTLIVGLLKNRLLIEDLLRRHPEILDERDRRPDRHLRAAAHRDDPPAQPDVGRPGAPVAPLLGEPRAGAGRS